MKKLLLLENKSRIETQNITQMGKTLGLDVVVKELSDFHINLDNLGATEEVLENYDCLWVRTYTDFSVVRLLCHIFEKTNRRVFGADSNSSSFIQDKMADLWQLKINGVPIPATSVGNHMESESIYKPYWGFGGFGILTENPNKPYYYQQELINKQSDIRIYTSYYKAIPLVVQRSNLCDFRTNKHQGGTLEVFSFADFALVESPPILEQVVDTSLNATKALNRPFSAIDLIKNGEEYQVLEVNRTPRIRLDESNNTVVIKAMLEDILAIMK